MVGQVIRRDQCPKPNPRKSDRKVTRVHKLCQNAAPCTKVVCYLWIMICGFYLYEVWRFAALYTVHGIGSRVCFQPSLKQPLFCSPKVRMCRNGRTTHRCLVCDSRIWALEYHTLFFLKGTIVKKQVFYFFLPGYLKALELGLRDSTVGGTLGLGITGFKGLSFGNTGLGEQGLHKPRQLGNIAAIW